MTAITAQKLTYVFMQELKKIGEDFSPEKLSSPNLKRAYIHFQEACDPKNTNLSGSLKMARNELNCAYGGIPKSDEGFYSACVNALNGTTYSLN